MGRPLSMDLRDRVVAAIGDGMSRRAAAARFGISISSAIRWAGLVRDRGNAAPQRQGGDKRSAQTERHASRILAALDAAPGITLAELRARLAADGGSVAVSGLWRFFARRQITRKKRRATRPSRTARTS